MSPPPVLLMMMTMLGTLLAPTARAAREQGKPHRFLDHVIAGDLSAVRGHLTAGRDPHTPHPDAHASHALHLAAAHGHSEIMEELVAHGADVNAPRDMDKKTPLHIAAVVGNIKSIKALLKHGADPTVKDTHLKRRTARDIAKRYGYGEIVQLLKEAEEKRELELGEDVESMEL